ncbi:MAG: adenylate/guanylate cyclase domain-containing protein, partial [Bacteroidota bacterium]
MSTRRLAAIMFTDIVGYTAMMQENEAHAVSVRQRHREVFERLHEQYQGTILQYYGDGTLSIFDSAVAATQCAIDMQLAFQEEPPVPLRIGIHTGDIIYSEQEAIGDGVNVAARVESIASAGSVMVSGQVAKYLNNQSDIPLLSMGHFAFKNVQEELEVFAVDREGLDVPNPKAITGKFSKHRAPNAKSGLAKVPIWARYLGGFALFLILAPIIYFPLYRTFSGSAANQDNLALQNLPAVSYEDQKRFYVSSFDNMGTDTTTDWLSLGIPYALEMDWDQDPHVLSIYPEGMEPAPMNSELEAAQNYKCDYLLRGNYEQKSDGYGIEISLYEVPNGQLFKQMSFWGEDFFSLLDTVSLETKKVLGVTEAELRTARDLPMRQILTNSIPAYRTLCQSYEGYLKQDYSKIGLYEKQAVGMDSSFAWAALMTATTAYSFLQSDEMAKKYIDLAMKHRKRLPEVFDAKVRQLNYRIADEPEKALELSKLLVELHPGNFSYRQNLINDYYSQDQFGAVMEQIEILQSLREDPCELFYLEGNTLLRMGEIKKGIERTLSCQRSYPNNASLAQTLGELYLADEQYEKARQSFQRAELLESSYLDWDKLEPHLSYMQDSIDRKDLPDLYENLVARYYHNRSTLFYFDVNTNGQLLFINGPRQQKYPYYPVGGNRFVAT